MESKELTAFLTKLRNEDVTESLKDLKKILEYYENSITPGL